MRVEVLKVPVWGALGSGEADIWNGRDEMVGKHEMEMIGGGLMVDVSTRTIASCGNSDGLSEGSEVVLGQDTA